MNKSELVLLCELFDKLGIAYDNVRVAKSMIIQVDTLKEFNPTYDGNNWVIAIDTEIWTKGSIGHGGEMCFAFQQNKFVIQGVYLNIVN